MSVRENVFVDHSYRAMLGTSFYDRLWELARLEELLQGVRTVVVYGPRNVGKSELVRYFVSKRLGSGRSARLLHRVVVVVDAEAEKSRTVSRRHPGRCQVP